MDKIKRDLEITNGLRLLTDSRRRRKEGRKEGEENRMGMKDRTDGWMNGLEGGKEGSAVIGVHVHQVSVSLGDFLAGGSYRVYRRRRRRGEY